MKFHIEIENSSKESDSIFLTRNVRLFSQFEVNIVTPKNFHFRMHLIFLCTNKVLSFYDRFWAYPAGTK